MEKAHPQIFDLFLQLFDEGRRSGAPEPLAIDPRTLLAGYLRPELVNRIDEIVVFNRLGRAELRKIVDRYLQGIEELGAERDLKLELDDDSYDYLLRNGASERFGARELRRVVDQKLRQPLAREFLRRGDKVGAVRVRVREGSLHLE